MAALRTGTPVGLGVLGDRLALSRPGMTILAQRLERRAVIQRHRHPRDHRQVLLTAAPTYLAAAARLYDPMSAQLAESLRQIPAATRSQALERLPQLIAIVHDHADTLLAEQLHRPPPATAQRRFVAPDTPGPWA